MAATTMWDLLSDIKTLTKNYANGTMAVTLKGMKTFKLGILGSNTVFPAVAITPRFETHGGYRNGGQFRADRAIDFNVYVKSSTPKGSGKQLQEFCHAIKEMFYDESNPDNYKFNNGSDDTVFSFSPGAIEYNVVEDRGSFLQTAILPFIFSSWETAPTFTKFSTITDTDLRTIGEWIHSTLEADNSLSKVKFFYAHSAPPIKVGNGCVVSVLENSELSTRRESGRDNPTGIIDLMTWTKASPFEGSLELNLGVVELIKDVLQKNQNLGGKAYRSNIDQILFGINQEAFLYSSRIVFNTWAYNTLPAYA